MTIRTEQYATLARANLEEWLVGHVHRCFATQIRRLGHAEVRALVQHGLRRSRDFGLEDARDVSCFIDVMFVFGRDFADDTALPWAAGALTSPQSASARAAKLRAEALAFLRGEHSEQDVDAERQA